MKKLIILLLAVIFSCGSFVSCVNEQNTESSINSTDENSSESSVETSEPITEIPENIEYFTGTYYIPESIDTGEPIYSNINVMEMYDREGRLRDYLLGPRPSDKYFLVGVSVYETGAEYDYENVLKFTREHLEKCGFIEIKDHPMIYDPKYAEELSACSAEEEENAVKHKYIEKMLPDIVFDRTKAYPEDLLICRFYVVGYISVSGLRELAQITDEGEKVRITWFPAPDDQERWLTIDYYG